MAAMKHAVRAQEVTRTALAADAAPESRRAWVEDAADCFRRHGVIAIRDAVPKAAVAAVLEDFRKRHDVHMAPGQTRLYRRFQTDPLRAQVPVAIDGPVADPQFFASPSVTALVAEMMGEGVVVGEMGVVITHPGAGPQETHRDSHFLFGGGDLDVAMPPFAMTVLIPLIDVRAGEGPTEYWPGSHKACDEEMAASVAPTAVALDAGGVTVHDSRVLHRGGAKPSGPVRPAVYLSFHRNWHQELYGYEHKPQLVVSPGMLDRLPERYRPLFAWALHLNRTSTPEELVHRWIGRLRRIAGRGR